MSAVGLHKLNGDTSWLFRLPTSSHPANPANSHFCNLVIDPWLDPTPQVDGSPLFSRQTRIEPSAFASLAKLDAWLHTQSSGKERIDAVLFSHPFTDHLHPETITDQESLAVLRRATIFTTNDSLAALRSIKVNLGAKVVNLSSIAVRQDPATSVLPHGITIDHLPAKDWAVSPAWSKLHGGILVSCSTTIPTQILYSPHGITPTSLPPHLTSQDDSVKRVLIHSFDRQTLPLIGTVACGFPNILHLIPVFNPHIVLATHDEHKQGEGIVGRLLSRQVFSLETAHQMISEMHADGAMQRECVVKQLTPGESIRIT
ncbi:hypothetical protein PHSY_001566 [Pseudozyma hubeiensis SY62]|uniref:Metallo-beta-lactamase domain-containing protein n=1 Tax=Pseudozyma hubeiensis (strain SY62) TaxID=1305764 RepID=R9NZ83_PSEHS|nr:hypothetical protein PHSY_001566 [Pseudozyma hubeiensis SY62]GAC93997.1 hypothetical protein PHSY_001566 [Pseudozyma hubeiensis SY62]